MFLSVVRRPVRGRRALSGRRFPDALSPHVTAAADPQLAACLVSVESALRNLGLRTVIAEHALTDAQKQLHKRFDAVEARLAKLEE